MEYRASYSSLLHAAASWSDNMVRLMVIFVVQTIVLPLGFLWVTWRFLRALARAPMAFEDSIFCRSAAR